jgi:hypothetical protein
MPLKLEVGLEQDLFKAFEQILIDWRQPGAALTRLEGEGGSGQRLH